MAEAITVLVGALAWPVTFAWIAWLLRPSTWPKACWRKDANGWWIAPQWTPDGVLPGNDGTWAGGRAP